MKTVIALSILAASLAVNAFSQLPPQCDPRTCGGDKALEKIKKILNPTPKPKKVAVKK